MMNNTAEIYIHIPFCVRKCNYCDFLSFNAESEQRDAYVDALVREILAEERKYTVPTVFFGGGTPSIMEPEHISRILHAIKEKNDILQDAEITLEANPGTLTGEKLEEYCNMGINRLSMGLQSAVDEELKLLGRIHTREVFEENYEAARKAGFDNINIDIMWAIPGQTVETLRETLGLVTGLGPEHISAYSLILEEGTAFYDRRHELQFPEEDEELEMYETVLGSLEEAGYEQYEISNYAKKGYRCRHNEGYWKRTPYRGYGLGVSSFIDNVRWKNISDMNDYISQCKRLRYVGGETFEKNAKNAEIILPTGLPQMEDELSDKIASMQEELFGWKLPRMEEEILDKASSMEEYIFLGMRMNEGISVGAFREEFGEDILKVYADTVKKYLDMELMCLQGDRLGLTRQGMRVSNSIFAEFLRI